MVPYPPILSLSVASQSATKYSVCIPRVDSNFASISITVSVTGGTTSLMLSNGLSGLMGLGFASLSGLKTNPFWETLYNTNQLSEPLFSFFLERYINQPLMDSAPGGVLTLGGTNSSLYQGSIEYTNLTGTPSYWLLNVSCQCHRYSMWSMY
jgi:hypothetical protein